MQTVKKIIRNILLGVISIIALLILKGMIEVHFIGYRDVDDFIPHTQYQDYFKKPAIEKISIKSLYKNIFKDTIYIFNYTDSCKILVWIMKQDNNAYFSNVMDTNQKEFKPEQLVGNIQIQEPSIGLDSKVYPHDFKNTALHFYYCKDIQLLINTKNCQYYHLKAGTIYITSDDHSYYDTYVSLNYSSYSDFMVYITNNKFYIFALYSCYKRDIAPDALKNIINLPLE